MTSREDAVGLIGKYVDGTATEGEIRELEAMLKEDRELRRTFVRYLNVDAALGGASALLRAEPSPQQPSARPWQRRLAVAGLAAAAIFIALFLWSGGSKPASTPSPFATLAAANDAVWSDPNMEMALRSGQLPPGPLRLESGTAEFLMQDGATVQLRGPTSLQFLERKRLFVQQGRVFCRCPSSESRISVETAATEVVDLGTEFSVETRRDQSTLVTVLSGEVQVGRTDPRRLRKGEAVEVRSDGILSIKPLAGEEFAELLLASPSVGEAVQRGTNLLRDPGFDGGLTPENWNGTEPNLQAVTAGGRSGPAVQISARGYAQWPQCRQKIQTGDISGRLVVASVWAAVAPEEPLGSRQQAMLKLVFLNSQGRDFAFAVRRFLGTKSAPGQFEQAQIAAFAPPGTVRVQVQLMLQSNLKESGSVIFDDASLVVADAGPGE